MSKVTAINIIIKKKNQLRKHKEGYVSYINIDEVLVWLNDIQKELEDWKMSVLISPEAYRKILQGDLDWLLKQPKSLEKDHIEVILKNLIKRIEEGKEF